MSDVFDLPEEVVNSSRGAMADDTITLPFPAPTIWWKNGSKADKQIGGVRYFGGWAISVEDMDAMNMEYPPDFSLEEWVNREGSEFAVLCARSFGFAAICKRKQWTQNNNGGWRSHIQVLGIMATYNKQKKAYQPYGPVILSAKGYAGKALEDALHKWDMSTIGTRREYAKNYPAWLFYAAIGTFSAEPTFVQWGSSQKSPGTPIGIWLPDEIKRDNLLAWFVGSETATQMNEYRTQAQDWIAAWKKQEQQQPANKGNGFSAWDAAASLQEPPEEFPFS